jgi:hypothetical protein
MKKLTTLLVTIAFLIPTPTSALLTTGLLHYWKLDESSGDVADSVGAITLTNTNTVGFGAAKINNGADFSGTNTNKSLKSSSAPGVGVGAMTMSGWINVTTDPASNVIYGLFTNVTNNSNQPIGNQAYYWNVAGTKKLRYNRPPLGVGDSLIDYNVTLSTATWYHVVIVYDGSNQSLYLDGTLVAGPTAQSGLGTDASSANAVSIGARVQSGSTATFFSGKVDEVGLWDRALTGSEITQLYNAGTGCQYSFAACTSATFPFFWSWDF